ncbi:MAG: purine-nucleoside phosphorylase [Clostridiales bacterium]|nr:purine-nucleoside phosphorylase [Clostridiales bacterium]
MDRIKKHRQNISSASEYIRSHLKQIPKIAVVLGSGLGPLADTLVNTESIPYSDIPGFAQSTAPGHEGRLIAGDLNGCRILAMQGRFHSYEGYDVLDVVLPVRVFHTLGIKDIILTNAAGGINPDFSEGALMMITDHIGFLAPPALWGENLEEFGPRFPDMTYAYSRQLFELARKASKSTGIKLNEGIYAYAPGAQYETPAEIRVFSKLGADAVGMSTVPEAVAARHTGMSVLAISCITNMAAGIIDRELNHIEVLETSKRVADHFSNLIAEIIKNIAEKDVQ